MNERKPIISKCRWLSLARSYEVSERLSEFNEEFKARYRSKE
jgi:hypothetical protein